MAEDDDRRLLEIERQLVGLLACDARLVKFAEAEGIAAASFRDPGNVQKYRRIIERCNGPPDNSPLYRITHVRRLARTLVESAPSRPPWIEQVQAEPTEQQHDQARQHHAIDHDHADAQTVSARSTRRVTSGPLLEKERRRIKSELRVLFRWLKKNGKAFPESELENFIKKLCAELHPRDPLDPNSVSPQDLGAHFRLTYKKRCWIENEETKRRIEIDWRRRYGRDPLFRFKRIGVDPADASPQVVSERYLDLRRAAYNQRRRDQRAQSKESTMQTETIQTQSTKPTSLRAAQMARTRAQMQTLFEAIGDDQPTVNALMEAVREHPAWRSVDHAKMRRTTLDRLDMLKTEGRIENGDSLPGPRGSEFRTVRRRKNDHATMRPRD